MALTGGRGVDVVMEHIGGEIFTESLKCLARGGIIVTVGAHAGEVVPFDIIPFFAASCASPARRTPRCSSCAR